MDMFYLTTFSGFAGRTSCLQFSNCYNVTLKNVNCSNSISPRGVSYDMINSEANISLSTFYNNTGQRILSHYDKEFFITKVNIVKSNFYNESFNSTVILGFGLISYSSFVLNHLNYLFSTSKQIDVSNCNFDNYKYEGSVSLRHTTFNTHTVSILYNSDPPCAVAPYVIFEPYNSIHLELIYQNNERYINYEIQFQNITTLDIRVIVTCEDKQVDSSDTKLEPGNPVIRGQINAENISIGYHSFSFKFIDLKTMDESKYFNNYFAVSHRPNITLSNDIQTIYKYGTDSFAIIQGYISDEDYNDQINISAYVNDQFLNLSILIFSYRKPHSFDLYLNLSQHFHMNENQIKIIAKNKYSVQSEPKMVSIYIYDEIPFEIREILMNDTFIRSVDKIINIKMNVVSEIEPDLTVMINNFKEYTSMSRKLNPYNQEYTIHLNLERFNDGPKKLKITIQSGDKICSKEKTFNIISPKPVKTSQFEKRPHQIYRRR